MEALPEDAFSSPLNESLNGAFNFANETFFPNNYVPYHLRLETYLVPVIFSAIFIVGILGMYE